MSVEHLALSWDRVEKDCATLARVMKERGIVNKDTKGIVAIARGGLLAAQLLGYYLGIRSIETATVIGYQGTEALKELTLNNRLSLDIGDGSDWIVADDLVDTGRSYRFLKTLLPKARYVAIYAKPQGAKEAEAVVETFPQDSWLDFPWEKNPIL